MATKTVLLTSGTTWTVPADLDTSVNITVTAISGGGGGGRGSNNVNQGSGAAGGALSQSSVSLSGFTPGSSVTYIAIGNGGVGATTSNSNGGAGGATWFNKSANTPPSISSDGALAWGGGSGGPGNSPGFPNTIGTPVGNTVRNGGNGGSNTASAKRGGGGGGSAAKLASNGFTGGAPGLGSGNGGGGGGGTGGNGNASSATTNGAGGAGGLTYFGAAGGAGGPAGGGAGTAGTNGGGGGGGGGRSSAGTAGIGAAGGAGTETAITAGGTAGSGGGGGGGGGNSSAASAIAGSGGSGGLYGGGGAGGGGALTSGNGGNGAQGAIIITYTTVNPVTISGTPSTVTQVGRTYSQQNTAASGVTPYTYAVSAGTLPAGTSLNTSTGLVSGTPTTAGAFSYTIRVTDNIGQTATTPTSGTIYAALALTATPSTLTQVGKSYSQSNTVSGGVGTYTYAVSAGSLPAGTSLNTSTGLVSGTPTTAGAFSYTIRVTDGQGTTATAATSGTIYPNDTGNMFLMF